MIKKTSQFLKEKFYIEIFIAVALFGIALAMGNMIEFIIYMLYFIIFLEIVRAVSHFIREQKIKITLLIDAFIILVLREFIVNVVKVNKEEFSSIEMVFSSSVNYHILILSGVLVFLFFLRYIADKKLYNKRQR